MTRPQRSWRCSMGLLLALAACAEPAPEGQVLLYLDTDAPLPGGQATPLFNRLRLEIIPDGASERCPGCLREFAITQGEVNGGQASVGIAPAPGSRPRVRVQLYYDAGAAARGPRPDATLETVARLPEVDEEGIVEATVMLRSEDVGTSRGNLGAPVEAEAGRAPGRAGSWAGAQVRDCGPPPEPGEVCVPGGAFWMGDPLLELSAVPDQGGQDERLVVLSPFYLDAAEVTVAEFRASGLAVLVSPGGPSDDPHEADTGIADCTYTSAPSDHDALPLNCITHNRAAAYCASLGKTLPSEAQLEMVMRGRGLGRYLWGDAAPACEDAVHERDGLCAPLGPGPTVAGSGRLDRLELPTGTVFDLAGNLSEWAADRWNRDAEPCWTAPLLRDPLCDQVSQIDGAGRSIRGGNWQGDDLALLAALRSRLFAEYQAVSSRVGFRCARPASK